MWSFFKKARASKNSDAQGAGATRRTPMRFGDLVADIGDFSDLAKHDVALKFWLPEHHEARCCAAFSRSTAMECMPCKS